MWWPFSKKQRTDSKEGGRNDGFVNLTTGMGVPGYDKTLGGSFYAKRPLDPQLLSDLYSDNDLAALVVDVQVDEAFRLGLEVQTGDAEEDRDISQWMLDNDILCKVADAARWGRLYGAAALVIGTDDGAEPFEPMPENVRAITYCAIVDRSEFTPNSWYPDGTVETYTVTPLNVSGSMPTTVVHESRMIIFGGAKTTRRKKLDNDGFDLSVLQRVYDTIEQFDSLYKNMEVLLSDGNQKVFKMSGLANALAADSTGQDVIRRRFQIMNQTMSMHRALVLDAGDTTGEPPEQFERQSATFSGLAPLVDKFVLRLSSATRIPATILMGQSPAGLSATGESDVRWFYDRTDAYREQDMEPRIRRLINILRSSTPWQERGASLAFKWPSLWSESESEQATAKKTQADADKVYIDLGVLTPEEVTLNRFGQGDYSFETRLSPEAIEVRTKSAEREYEMELETLNAPPEVTEQQETQELEEGQIEDGSVQ